MGAANKYYERMEPNATSPFFYIWIASYIISFTYTFLWDVFMDWGENEKRSRVEIIHSIQVSSILDHLKMRHS